MPNRLSEMQLRYESLARLSTSNSVPSRVREEMLQIMGHSTYAPSPPTCTVIEGRIGSLARDLLETASPLNRRKIFGQFFTPKPISALVCAASISDKTTSIIDPMCGTGNMLWAALERVAHLRNSPPSISGVEVDPLVASVAEYPPNERYCRFRNRPSILNEDSFTRLISQHLSLNHDVKYDAIIGNPPYVRRQYLAQLVRESAPDIFNVFKSELHSESDSYVASMVIRASLISDIVSKSHNIQEFAKNAISLIKMGGRDDLLDVETAWLKLVSGYSGLADLSLPSWLMTWRLTKPSGMVAYVTTSSWRSREYAKLLRYFMLRMLEPVLIIEQEGINWFHDALQPTSLMVLRARDPEQASIPLSDRDASGQLCVIKIRKEYDLSNPLAFQKIAESFGCELSKAENRDVIFADAILKGMLSEHSSKFWEKETISEQSLVDGLVSEYSMLNGKVGFDYNCLEGLKKRPLTYTRDIKGQWSRIPEVIAKVLNVGENQKGAFVRLEELGIEINQGLRTGCNAFFYVTRLAEDEIRKLFSEDASIVSEAFERPSETPDTFARLVSKLMEMGAITPDEPAHRCPSSMLVRLSPELGSRLAVLPISVLRPAILYSGDVVSYSINVPSLKHYVLVCGGLLTNRDYFRAKKYPKNWFDIWTTRDHVGILPSCANKYIDIGETTMVKRNDKTLSIPELSAVYPNNQWPKLPKIKPLYSDDATTPGSPRGWYTLSLQPRHFGTFFIPRVNYAHPRVMINSSEPVIIDANFSTVTNKSLMSNEVLLALFNSNWTKANLESICTPMGGGALKVEASHLKRLTLPKLNGYACNELAILGRKLANGTLSDAERIIKQIDGLVAFQIADNLDIEAAKVCSGLEKLSKDLLLNRMNFKKRRLEGNVAWGNNK